MTDTADQADDAETPRAHAPVRLSLTGTSADRRRLLLQDDQGVAFTLEITPDLRAALGGGTTRLGQLEIKMSSSIRPREIQTRIRAGESAETVAAAAGTTVDAIMPYVGPVLAERGHVAGRAQRASLRRTPGEGGATQSRVLGDAVEGHLRGRGADPAAVQWDAYRRETGRWVLTAAFETGERSGTARYTYDAPGNYALCDNDDARWLVGDVVAAPEPTRDDLQQVRERRLAAVPAEELPLGDEALDLVLDEPATAPAASAEPAGRDVEPPADEPLRPTAPPETSAAPAAEDDGAARAETETEAERARHRRPVQKKRGRASVPSWDEIMFGSSD